MKTTKKAQKKNAAEINEITNEMESLYKYRNRISVIPEGLKTMGKGIYTKKKEECLQSQSQKWCLWWFNNRSTQVIWSIKNGCPQGW